MLRPIASLLALFAASAILAPVPADAAGQGSCLAYSEESAAAVVERAAVIVVGSISESVPGISATIAPEFYLKGATLPQRLVVRFDPRLPCPPAALERGERSLLILGDSNGTVAWPGDEQVIALRDGKAYLSGDRLLGSESELVQRIRGLTGQYSVPAASPGQGAGIDWRRTVLPVAAAILVVFAIGLVLMREWHRIDPT